MRRVTKIVILITFVSLVIYDIIAIAIEGTNATISNVIATWSLRLAFIPLFYGILGGHFFVPGIFRRAKWKYIAMTILFLVIGTVGTILNYSSDSHILPLLWLLIGIPIGAYMWPQEEIRQ